MAASKSLILFNGIAGFAATCLAAAGGFEVNNLLQSSSNSSSLEQSEEDEFEEVTKEDEDLGIPSGCFTSTTCDLTAEELRKLKFERRSDSSISFGGLSDSDTFELTVEDSGDSTKYPGGRKYILKAKETSGTVTIEGVKGGDIDLGSEGVDLREKQGGRKLEKVPEEINDLGIPKRCEDETCELTKEQLQRLRFETKDDNTSIEVNGLTGKNTVTLTVAEVTGDTDNYPKGKKYTLTSRSGTVIIRGVKGGDVVLEKDRGVDFREKSTGEQLETVENSLGIPRRCETSTESPCQLTKEQLQKLKFETETGSSITVEDLADNETVTLTIENKENDLNYPKGKKYTLKSENGEVKIKGVKGGDIELEDSQEVVIRETGSGGKLEKAPEEVDELGIPRRCVGEQSTQTCELTKDQLQRFKFEPKGNEEIRVEGSSEGNIVTLKVETINDPINYPKGKKYTLTSKGGQVRIGGVKEGGIVLGANRGVSIRETRRGGRLEEVIGEVDKLGIPKRCTTGKACQLTREELQRLTFETKNSGGTTVSGLGSNVTVELKVGDPGDKINYPHNKKYTLKSNSGTVRIRGVKEGEIVLDSGNDVVFREKESGGKLERASEDVDKLGIPRRCITSSSACELTKEQLKRLKFEAKDNKSSIWVTGLGNSDKVTLKVDNPGDKTNYPKERRYIFKAKREGVIIKGTKDWDIELEKDKELLVRETIKGEKLETVVDSLGIPRSCNAENVKRGSYPQTCELTEELLKNIKFKTFDGKTANVKVTNLYGTEKLKLTISWTEDSRYPDKKKYSFYITTWKDVDIKITRNGERVTIDKEKESLFKNNGGQLELVEKKAKSEVKREETLEILKKLELERLKLIGSDFTSLNSKKHNKKTADFFNVGDLKKIQFKDFGGGAESTNPSSLNNNKKIRVSLDWDDDAKKFPYNMKFSFQPQNENFSLFEFKKGENSIKILKKLQNAFKVENQGDKWYLVESK